MRRSVTAAAYLLLIIAHAALAHGEDSRTSMGITGCTPKEATMAATLDGRITFAGCSGPKGLFYSRDQGRNWTFAGAAGTAYTDGTPHAVFVTDTSAYMLLSGLMKTSLPAGNEAWSPAWQLIPDAAGFWPVQQSGQYLIGFIRQPGISFTVQIFDTQQDKIVSSVNAPDPNIEMVPGGDGSAIYAASGVRGSEAGQNSNLYRIPFNRSAGTLGGAGEWVTTKLMENGIPQAPGLPSPTGYPNPVDAFRLQNLVIAPDNRIYASFPIMHGSGPGGSCNQPIYVSADGGASFQRDQMLPPSGESAGDYPCTPMRGSFFLGNNFLIESFFSADAGNSWTRLMLRDGAADPALENWRNNESISMDPVNIFLEPSAARWGLFQSNVGYARLSSATGNVAGADRQWEKTSGFLAIELYGLSKAYQNPNLVIVATASGYSVTRNFLSENPAWLANYCAEGDCYGGRSVAADPSDPNAFYLGGNPWIRRVTVDAGNTPQNFTVTRYIYKRKAFPADFNSVAADQASYGMMYTNPSLLPNTLMLALQKDQGSDPAGGLFFYDLARPACPQDACDLGQSSCYPEACLPTKTAVFKTSEGDKTHTININRVIAVSSSIIFAVSGSLTNNVPAASFKGFFRSSDGGTTFLEVSDPLIKQPNRVVTAFAYDSKNDTLYAPYSYFEAPGQTAPSGGVLRLKRAAAGNEQWEAAGGVPLPAQEARLTVTAIAIDPLTNLIAIGGQSGGAGKVWTSDNGGDSWSEAAALLRDEKVNFLSYDEVIEGSVGIRSKSSRLVQGSDTGLYAMKKAASSCSLAAAKACKKKVRAGATCTLKAVLKKSLATKKTRVRIERSRAQASGFKKLGAILTLSGGKKSLSVRADRIWYYRAKFSSPACTTSAVRIEVKR